MSKRKIIKCKECGKEKPHAAKGLCNSCYYKQNLKICTSCNKLKAHNTKGLCYSCYQKQFPPKPKICSSCNQLKPHNAKRLCSACYNKQNVIVCSICGELKRHHARGLCINCHNHKIGKSKPMSEDKFCSNYLGIVVAEKVLSKVFKDVIRMPNFNAGYDFICNKGMKIDVKSGVLKFRKNQLKRSGRWQFKIKRNKIADYFLIIAFDDRTSLTPQHLWLIPSEKINHLSGLSIEKNKTYKWSQYSQPIDKVISCCDILKNK